MAPATARPVRRCGRCVACDGPPLSWCPPPDAFNEFAEWWPAGLASPTVYFYLRARQLHYQCSVAQDHQQTWRLCEDSASALLAKRGAPALRVNVPTASTNVAPGKTVKYVGQLVVSLVSSAPPLSSSSCQAQPKPGSPAAATRLGDICSPAPIAAMPASLRRSRSGGSSSVTSCSSSSNSRALLQPFKRTRLRATPGAVLQQSGHLVAPAANAVQVQGEQPSVQSAGAQPKLYRSLSFRQHGRQKQCAAFLPASPGGCCVIPLEPVRTAVPAGSGERGVLVATHTEAPQGQPPSNCGGWGEPRTSWHAGWLAHLRDMAADLGWKAMGTPEPVPVC